MRTAGPCLTQGPIQQCNKPAGECNCFGGSEHNLYCFSGKKVLNCMQDKAS